jgi:hypothetical protein
VDELVQMESAFAHIDWPARAEASGIEVELHEPPLAPDLLQQCFELWKPLYDGYPDDGGEVLAGLAEGSFVHLVWNSCIGLETVPAEAAATGHHRSFRGRRVRAQP